MFSSQVKFTKPKLCISLKTIPAYITFPMWTQNSAFLKLQLKKITCISSSYPSCIWGGMGREEPFPKFPNQNKEKNQNHKPNIYNQNQNRNQIILTEDLKFATHQYNTSPPSLTSHITFLHLLPNISPTLPPPHHHPNLQCRWGVKATRVIDPSSPPPPSF